PSASAKSAIVRRPPFLLALMMALFGQKVNPTQYACVRAIGVATGKEGHPRPGVLQLAELVADADLPLGSRPELRAEQRRSSRQWWLDDAWIGGSRRSRS